MNKTLIALLTAASFLTLGAAQAADKPADKPAAEAAAPAAKPAKKAKKHHAKKHAKKAAEEKPAADAAPAKSSVELSARPGDASHPAFFISAPKRCKKSGQTRLFQRISPFSRLS